MSSEERSAWTMLVVTVGAYAVYLTVILGGSSDIALADRPYAIPMLWTIGGAIVANVALTIVTAIVRAIVSRNPEKDKKDLRDREIYHFGERVGQSFIVIGGVGALVLAMLQAPYFWIANALYLGFVLSAILSSITKVVAYRRGMPQW
ncbi:MAG: hypothetical protein ABL886_05060 [Rhodoglobus sp.]